MEHTLKAIHVDKDGTFSLSEPRNKSVIEGLAAEYGIFSDMDANLRHAKWKKELWGMCEGQAEPNIHAILVTKFPDSDIDKISPHDFEVKCKVLYEERHDEVEIREGMVETLESYKSQGVKVAIVTSSGLESTEADLKKAFGSVVEGKRFFDAIVTSDDIAPEHRKPSPVPFLTSCKRLGVSESAGNVAFEDSMTGVRSAMACFGEGDNRVVRFLEDDNREVSGSLKLTHVYNMQQAELVINELQDVLANGFQSNSVTNVAKQRVLKK